jgi:hypothetical protein
MEGPGIYNEIVKGIKDDTGADGVLLMVLGGKDGHGVSVMGDFGSHFQFADMLEKLSKAVRSDAMTKVREAQEEQDLPSSDEIESDLPDREVNSEEEMKAYKQIDLRDLTKVAQTVMTFVQQKTGLWDEGVHALAIALAGLVTMRERFGEGDTPGYAANRAKEVLDRVLQVERIAIEVPGDRDESLILTELADVPHAGGIQ